MAFSRFGKFGSLFSPIMIREWSSVVFSEDFSCSYVLLEGNILVVKGCGFTSEESERASLEFGKRIIDENIPSGEKYILIHDWRQYRNSTPQARKLFMDSVIGNDRLVLIVFCNCDLTQSLSIKLGRALGFLKTSVHITPTYHEALRAAACFRDSGLLPPEKINLFRIRGSRAARLNEDLLSYLERIDWKTGKMTGDIDLDVRHPLLPVFDTITVIRSGLEHTFQDRDRAERELREYQQNLEVLVRERTAALEASERRYSHLLALSPAPIAVLSPSLSVDYVNAAFVSLFGYSLERFSALGDFFGLLCQSAESESDFRSFVEQGMAGEKDIELRTLSGKSIFVQVSLNSLPDAVMLSFTDITDRKKAESRLFELSLTDELTGIYNRRHFVSVLSREMQQFARLKADLALLIIDIDHFKRINDTLGHQAGDAVLRELSARISEQIRDFDYFFRIGGEEFALIMPNTGLAEASLVAERLRLAIASREFSVDGKLVPVSISVGLAPAVSDTVDPESLFRAADTLLYRAKNEGRNRVCVAH